MEYLVLYFVNFIIFAKGLEVRINMDSPQATVEKEFLSVTLDGGWQTSNFRWSFKLYNYQPSIVSLKLFI